MKSILLEYNGFRFQLSASSHDDVSYVSAHADILVLYSASAFSVLWIPDEYTGIPYSSECQNIGLILIPHSRECQNIGLILNCI